MVQKRRRGGRPRLFDAEDAIAHAVRVFWGRGFERTTLEEVERSTGLRRSSLYNAFGSKRQLFLAALRSYNENVASRMTEPLECGTAGLADLTALLDALETHLRSGATPPGCLIVNTMTELGDSDRAVSRETRAYVRRWRDALGATLSRAADRNELEPGDPEERVNTLIGLLIAINVGARSGVGWRETGRLLDAARAQLASWAR